MGDSLQSGNALRRSCELAAAGGDDPLVRYHLGPTLGYLGMVQEMNGDVGEGLASQMEGLRLATQRDDRRQMAAARIYLGATASIQGNVPKATEHLRIAVDLLEDLGDLIALYCALGFLGFAHAQRNELEQAQALLDRALKLAAKSGSAIYVPVLQAYRADVEIRAGRAAAAVEPLRAAIELGEKTHQRPGEADARRILAWALHYGVPGADAEAEIELRLAADIHRDCGSRVVFTRTLFELAGFLRETGAADEAARIEQEARTIADAHNLDWLPMPHPAPPPDTLGAER